MNDEGLGHGWNRRDDVRTVLGNGAGVSGGQGRDRRDRSLPAHHEAGGCRVDGDQVGAHPADAVENAPLRSLPDRNHQDDRADSDDDARDAEERPQRVCCEDLAGQGGVAGELHGAVRSG